MHYKRQTKPLEPFPPLEETGPLVVLREAWGGKPELKCKSLSRHPIRFIFLKTIELTPTTEFIETCAEKLVWLQKRHRERGRRSDIRYNFVVGSDGYVYECRGWHLKPDMEGRNWSDFPDMVAEDLYGESMSSKSLFIGFFEPPDDRTAVENMVKAKCALIQYGLKRNYIAKEHTIYKLYPEDD